MRRSAVDGCIRGESSVALAGRAAICAGGGAGWAGAAAGGVCGAGTVGWGGGVFAGGFAGGGAEFRYNAKIELPRTAGGFTAVVVDGGGKVVSEEEIYY